MVRRAGMPLSYHHHMAAVVETEQELDAFMKYSGEGIPLLMDAGHLAFAGGDVLRAIDNHHARINHVHVKDIRRPVVDSLDRSKQSFLDAVALGAFTVPGDGSLDSAQSCSAAPTMVMKAGSWSKPSRTRRRLRRRRWPRSAMPN